MMYNVWFKGKNFSSELEKISERSKEFDIIFLYSRSYRNLEVKNIIESINGRILVYNRGSLLKPQSILLRDNVFVIHSEVEPTFCQIDSLELAPNIIFLKN